LKIVSDDERDDSALENDVPPRRRANADEVSPAERRRRFLIVVPLVMAAAAVVALVFTMIETDGTYSRPVDALLRDRAKFEGRTVSATGKLVPGTLVRRDSPCEYRFKIQQGGMELPVSFKHCAAPESLRDVPELEVTAQGVLQKDGTLDASKIMTKCPTRYTPEEKAKGRPAIPTLQNM
jgi:cytochrome c-type biogenesis protein CcmE